MVATVPLFAMCFSRLFGIRTRKIEWLGILVGLAGIMLLNSGGHGGQSTGRDFSADCGAQLGIRFGVGVAHPAAAGAMAGSIEMLAAGAALLLASALSGERECAARSSRFPVVRLPDAVRLDYRYQRLYVSDPQRLAGDRHQLRLR